MLESIPAIEALLGGVDRPIAKRLASRQAEIADLLVERADNLARSASSGGDAKLAARRRAIDDRIEELGYLSKADEACVPHETATALEAELKKARAIDAEQREIVAKAKRAVDEAERAFQESVRALEFTEQLAAQLSRSFSIANAIRVHRDNHRDLYDSSIESQPVLNPAEVANVT